MTPIKTPYSNITYVAEGCNDLPATITRSPSGQDEVETCWELTDEEVEQVIKNRKVYLYIMGLTDPAKTGGCSTEMLPNGLLRLNINTDKVAGKSIEDLDEMFLRTKNTVCNSFKDALIHESGHAKLISGMNPDDVKKLYKELEQKGIGNISDIAAEDGAEAIAEIEVLIRRGDIVPEDGLRLYRSKMR